MDGIVSRWDLVIIEASDRLCSPPVCDGHRLFDKTDLDTFAYAFIICLTYASYAPGVQ